MYLVDSLNDTKQMCILLFEKAIFLNAIGNLYEAFSVHGKKQNKFYDFKIIDEAIVPLDANKSVSKKFAPPLNLSRLLRSL